MTTRYYIAPDGGAKENRGNPETFAGPDNIDGWQECDQLTYDLMRLVIYNSETTDTWPQAEIIKTGIEAVKAALATIERVTATPAAGA